MSSDEGGLYGTGPPASKRPRRSNNACDLCRKRKIRCDGKQFTSGKCTNCKDHNNECTFTVTTKKYPPGYVTALEIKVKKLTGLIQRMLPGHDFTQEIGFELTHDNWMLPGVCGAPEPLDPSPFLAVPAATVKGSFNTPASSALSARGSGASAPTTPILDDQHSSDDDTRERTVKLQNLRGASAPRSSLMSSYLGRSSATELVRKAFEMRAELAPDIHCGTMMRSKLWKRPAWLTTFEGEYAQKPLDFPEQSLLDELVEHYFTNVNILTPVLHRPSFESDLQSYLHLRERNFGNVLLLVCALGSRFTHDRRVLIDGDQTWHSAGWKWFMQTRIFDDATLLSTTSHLHVLQAACLATLYTCDIAAIHAWMLVGSGIRFALDIGAHKRRAYGSKPSLEDELFKRSFWALVHFDRTLSAGLGRPRCIQEEDFDLEMPICCDDEYLALEHPEQATTRPSLLSYFVWTLRLSQIQGLALRTVYASTKARVHYNFQGEEWMSNTVAHLDSLLNDWANSVPEHLRWDPMRTDDTFFSQSAHLHLQYRTIQLMIHRPSIAARGLKPLPALSLAVCTSAARSVARVADALNKRKPHHLAVLDVLMWTLGVSAIVLLVGIGNARLSNATIDHKQTLADVELLLCILREREARWLSAGRQIDVLEAFKALGETTDKSQSVMQRKRPRAEDPPTQQQQHCQQPPDPQSEPSVVSTSQTTARDSGSGVDWKAPSFSGHVPTETPITSSADFPLNGPLTQNTSAVFGNIDLGALFGLGDASWEGMRPWSPIPIGDTMDASSVGPPHSGEGMEFRPEEWSGMAFDLGADDWQWMTPSQQGMWDQDFAGGSGQ